jgi:hypothetical protein
MAYKLKEIQMDKTTVMGILKAIAACLAIAGIQMSPETQTDILEGWMALHVLLSAIQAKFTKDN